MCRVELHTFAVCSELFVIMSDVNAMQPRLMEPTAIAPAADAITVSRQGLGRRIKHIVMWTLRGDSPEQRSQAASLVKEKFEGLRGLIPGLQLIEVGVDSSGAEYACDVVLYSEFDCQQSLDAYASHPEHLRVRQELGDLRVQRYQVDYPVA